MKKTEFILSEQFISQEEGQRKDAFSLLLQQYITQSFDPFSDAPMEMPSSLGCLPFE